MNARIKQFLFGSEGSIKIKAGVAKGLIMHINPENKSLRILGFDEREIAKKFREYAMRSGSFVDIGASDGYYGLIFRKLNPSGSILLFDAETAFLRKQEVNFQLNEFGDSYESYCKYVGDETAGNSISLDDILSRKEITGQILLKIDVDGGELLVLKGIQQTLRSHQCNLIVETHSKELEDSCIALLQELGYRARIIDKAWWRIIIPELRPIEHNRWFFAEKPVSGIR